MEVSRPHLENTWVMTRKDKDSDWESIKQVVEVSLFPCFMFISAVTLYSQQTETHTHIDAHAHTNTHMCTHTHPHTHTKLR